MLPTYLRVLPTTYLRVSLRRLCVTCTYLRVLPRRFVLAPLALGYLADYSGAPNAMVALAGVVASATGVFGVLGKPRKLGR